MLDIIDRINSNVANHRPSSSQPVSTNGKTDAQKLRMQRSWSATQPRPSTVSLRPRVRRNTIGEVIDDGVENDDSSPPYIPTLSSESSSNDDEGEASDEEEFQQELKKMHEKINRLKEKKAESEQQKAALKQKAEENKAAAREKLERSHTLHETTLRRHTQASKYISIIWYNSSFIFMHNYHGH